MAQESTNNSRTFWASGTLVVVFACAALSQAKLQIVDRESTLDLARKTKRFTLRHTDYAKRGSILAADGKPLAQDQEVYELNLEFDKVPHADGFYMELSAASGLPASEFSTLAATLDVKHAHRSWRKPISSQQSKSIQEVKARWRANGVSVRRLGRRSYPLGAAASGIVGVIRDGNALSGLEVGQDKFLKGVDAVKIGLTDKNGAFLPMRMEQSNQERKDGKDLTLTIDRELQQIAASSVKRAVELNRAENGVAVVIDPKTGDVLAMANWPSFTPYAPDGTELEETGNSGFNVAIRGVLEPGSTFKTLTLAMGLDSGKISMNSTTTCTGEYHPSTATIIHCDSHHGNRAHGLLTPELAIAKSCNVSAAMWARDVGRDTFQDYVDKLGLVEPTRIGFAREAVGSYFKNEFSWRLQLANMGFGQSITCTPIALASAFSTLANGGVRIPPRLIKKVGDEEIKPKPGVKVFSAKAAGDVLHCMEAVVQDPRGTGHDLRIPGFRIAGKTGTAQKNNSSANGFVSSFVGVVPANDPKAVVLVMINHPTGKAYYGATVAGPAFTQIAKAVLRRYAVPRTEPIVSVVHSTTKLSEATDLSPKAKTN